MAINVTWDTVPSQLIQIIGNKMGSLNDFIRFSAVSKTWQSVMSERREAEKELLLLSPEWPLLLLAEEVQGTLLSCDIANNEDEEGYKEDRDDDEYLENEEGRRDEDQGVHQPRIAVGSTREIYSLSTRRLYTIELPEAAGKELLGINKGWLLTVGKNYEANLLHPLLRKEIALPSMHSFRVGNQYDSYEGVCMKFVGKAVMSCQVQPNKNVLHNDRPDPTIMIIYGRRGDLGFARPGDKDWTKVDVQSEGPLTDITYCGGKFYSIDSEGSTFVCDIYDDSTNGRQARGTLFAKCPLIEPEREFDEKYLVESGGNLWLLIRLRRIKRFRPPNNLRVKYCTVGFLVWKLGEEVLEDGLHTWNQKTDLENNAFFIGRNASASLQSAGCITPNCIYFTDDAAELYFPDGGGHDMGVFNMERGTIMPHFQGQSTHPVSPPLWYI